MREVRHSKNPDISRHLKKQIWKSELSHDCLQSANQQCTVEICDSYEYVARSISTLFQSKDESQCNLAFSWLKCIQSLN